MGNAQVVVERPIAFPSDVIGLILQDAMTQTRRPVRWEPLEKGLNLSFTGLEAGLYNTTNPESGWVLRSRGRNAAWNDRTKPVLSPFGRKGDRLWVQEKWAPREDLLDQPGTERARRYLRYAADRQSLEEEWHFYRKWRSAAQMPRWASRIDLAIEDVRVERLSEVIPFDCAHEGIQIVHADGDCGWYGIPKDDKNWERSPVEAFRTRWAKGPFEKKHPWDTHPWVWVVTFARVPAPVPVE